jgi:hypothetical protein
MKAKYWVDQGELARTTANRATKPKMTPEAASVFRKLKVMRRAMIRNYHALCDRNMTIDALPGALARSILKP